MLHYGEMVHHVYPSRRRPTLVSYMVGMVNHSMQVKLLVELLSQSKRIIFTQLNLWMEQTTYRLLSYNMCLQIFYG